ncbi:MAG: SDR family NAD(P)-dependent oxidoreductase [Candidatus Levybacteria bacterium]|nr:SDR family NAD(P)-dependent oxidoreductase [Candidatus Levybacteria bacterium]
MTKHNSSNFYHNKKILITGGMGFIGSTLARKLLKLNAKVIIVDSFKQDSGANFANIKGIEKKITLNIVDVRDQSSMNILVYGVDIVFNLAGSPSHVDSMSNPITDLDINCRGTLILLEACRKNNPKIKIIYAGTRNEYGRAKTLPVTELHSMEPTDINGINCVAADLYHRLYYKTYGIKTCVLLMGNVYGPRHQMKHPRQGALNWFMRQIIDNERVVLYGNGEQIRDCIYVDDMVNALIIVGSSRKAWGETYNVAAYPVSLKEFVEIAISVHGSGKYTCIPFPADRKSIEVGDFIADCTKIKKSLGWEPKINLKEGIKRTLAFYEKSKKHYWH